MSDERQFSYKLRREMAGDLRFASALYPFKVKYSASPQLNGKLFQEKDSDYNPYYTPQDVLYTRFHAGTDQEAARLFFMTHPHCNKVVVTNEETGYESLWGWSTYSNDAVEYNQDAVKLVE